jgi:hypothetical protein
MRNLILVCGATVLMVAAPRMVAAQEGPGGLIDPGRDCQTVTTCRFVKGGSYRGCVSSYSCRVCRFVSSKCTIGGVGRICRRLRCTWGD